MSLDWPFEHFDPKSDLVIPYFNRLHSIAFRAQAILHARDSKEIVVAAQIVCMMLEEYYTGEAGYNRTEASIDTPSPVVERVAWRLPDNSPAHALAENISPESLDLFCLETEVKYLRDYIGSFSFDEPEFQNPRQEELFSAFALWCVADVLEVLDPLGLFPGGGETGRAKEISLDAINTAFTQAGERALVAMDAVCYAEKLLEKGGIPAGSGDSGTDGIMKKDIALDDETIMKIAHRALSSKGGIAKANGYKPTRDRAIKYYLEHGHKYKERTKLVKQMMQDLKWYKIEPRTIDGYIREYIKKNSPQA